MGISGNPALLDGVPAVWLRANCPCRACLDPRSHQRLCDIPDQPDQVRIAEVTADEHWVQVVFEPDGHRAIFARSWLTQARVPAEDGRTEDAKRVWKAEDFS